MDLKTLLYDLEEEYEYIPHYYRHLIPHNWNRSGNRVNVLERLSYYDDDWQEIADQFGPKFKVNKIWRIQNPRTYGRYAKKAEKYEKWFEKTPRRWLLFHGTQAKYVESIIDNNIDFRNMHTKASSFYSAGEGIYFTEKTAYADYCVGGRDSRCFMFDCEVLVGNCKTVSNRNSVRFGPPALREYKDEVDDLRFEGKDPPPFMLYDTTKREGKDEFVKFGQNEFYTKHIIMYERRYY